MNLLHLRYFHEVARTRSFTESARNLRVSQPAISKLVRSLEEDLGQALLERRRDGVRLTDRGEALFQAASRIFAEAEAAEEEARSESRELRGEWTLGVSDNIAVYLVPRVLGRFKQRHPGLKIGLFCGTSSQIKSELHYDRCQLGVFFTPLKPSEPFESRQVAETEFWIAISRKNRWFSKTRLSLDDIRKASVPRIESRHADYSGGFPAHFHSRRLGLTAAPWLEVNQHEVKKRLVMEGFGYALLTRHTVEAEVERGELLRVGCAQKLKAPIHAVWRRGRRPGRASEAFLAEFSASFARQ